MYHYNRPRPKRETPDQRRRRWEREEREYQSRQREQERHRLQEETERYDAEQIRLAARTPAQIAADQVVAEQLAAWRAEAEAERQRHQEWLDRRAAERRSPHSTFGT